MDLWDITWEPIHSDETPETLFILIGNKQGRSERGGYALQHGIEGLLSREGAGNRKVASGCKCYPYIFRSVDAARLGATDWGVGGGIRASEGKEKDALSRD